MVGNGVLNFRGCPKVTANKIEIKEQRNIFALVQIFNAIPSPSFSAPAELRMINPNPWSLSMLIRVSSLCNCRAQYILGVRQVQIPSKDGSGRLNLQCRFDISLLLRKIPHPVTLGQSLILRLLYSIKEKSEKKYGMG
jgi:hypothetical protein